MSNAVITSWHPLVDGHPPVWSSSFGEDEYGPFCSFQIKGVEQWLRWVPPGTFWMGSEERPELEGYSVRPRHCVTIQQGFWLFDTPCAQALWTVVMGSNPSHFKDEKCPGERVSWEGCQQFITRANGLVEGLSLRLPTEAEWERACRAGTETERYSEDLDAIACYDGNSGGTTHPVKEKEPNPWGMYDMLGNVWEWCQDGPREYTEERVVDPVGPMEAYAYRVVRGGGWGNLAQNVHAAYRIALHRDDRNYDLGFRCLSQQ